MKKGKDEKGLAGKKGKGSCKGLKLHHAIARGFTPEEWARENGKTVAKK